MEIVGGQISSRAENWETKMKKSKMCIKEEGKRPCKPFDKLSGFLERILREHLEKNKYFPTWREVLIVLKNESGKGVVKSVKDDPQDSSKGVIKWGVSRRTVQGKYKRTSYSALQDRLTRIRDKIKKENLLVKSDSKCCGQQ
jgi:hypothetical protein